MPNSYKNLATAFITSALIISCQKENKVLQTEATETSVTPKKRIILESFTEYPPETDGCSCTFASDSTAYSQDKHIYVNDFADVSFVKINGKLLEFRQTSNIKKDSHTVAKYKAENYIMTVTVKYSRDTRDESEIMAGLIEIEDNKGNKTEQPFYGECGC